MEGFDIVTPDHWQSLIQHVDIHFEDHSWSNHGLYEELVNEVIVQVGGESGESDDFDQSDSSNDKQFQTISYFLLKGFF